MSFNKLRKIITGKNLKGANGEYIDYKNLK